MSASIIFGGRPAGRKSPLRVVSELDPFTFDEVPAAGPVLGRPEVERPPEPTAAADDQRVP